MIGIPNFDYSNDKSAVLSYLISIREAFERNGDKAEFALGKSADQSKYTDSGTSKSSGGIKGAIKRVVRKWPWLYQSLVFRKYLKDQKALYAEIAASKQYDLIVEFHTVGSTLGVELAKKWGSQFSVIFDSPIDEQFVEMYKTKSAYWSAITNSEKRTMEGADRIMCYSPACKNHLKSKYNLKGAVNILPSALNKTVSGDRIETENFNIGFVGSFLIWHKLDMLVKVFADFQQKNKNARLILLGYGEEWHRINLLVEKLNLKELVHMPGFVSEEELAEQKRKFTIATMPGSNWYGSPLKLFEYAQQGIPFIAPVSDTVSSVFTEGEHCLYVKKEDEAGSLMTALETFYSDPELRNRIGTNVRRYVEDEFNEIDYGKKLVKALG